MEISMYALARMFLYAVFLGVGYGALYDVLRITRVMLGVRYDGLAEKGRDALYARSYPLIGHMEPHAGKVKTGVQNLVVGIEDFLFCLTGGAVFCVFLYYTNNGTFRFLALAGVLAGFYLYYQTLGRLVMSISGMIDAFLKILLKILLFALAIPFRWVYNVIVKVYLCTVGRLIGRLSHHLAVCYTKRRMKQMTADAQSYFSRFV